MAVRITLKSGVSYRVDAFHDDVVELWKGARPTSLFTFKWLDGGIPLKDITINLNEIEHVRQDDR